ncbi:alpha/beta-hydrolase family protein [Rhodococcus sp. IEGM 1354]|uniref:alpha/beta-hydrolase family protein n=1 Tax=Rhodococcus sp. IEGM 1354 TaxID=3047088 RepID=UPI0024B7344B|nr:alpha/beta-hydrolase family protein [Rhodococcus sp. IEGM 1354]MDI9931390.1 alpha/beta-hydrolase family protein [Rhodococcus sp. IEGM 1354]
MSTTAIPDRGVEAPVESDLLSTNGLRLPRLGTSMSVAVAVAISSTPSLLPRSAATAALFTGFMVALALTVAWTGRRVFGSRRPASQRLRAWTVGTAALISSSALASNMFWQNRLRAAMNVEPVSWSYIADVAGGALCVALVLCGAGSALRRICSALGRNRCVALLVTVGALSYTLAVPFVWSTLSASYSASNSAMDDAGAAPTSETRSGGPGSSVPWRTLGREGRAFASGGQDLDTVRTYVGLESAATPDQRVALAVSEMERAGAFERNVVVVAIPTGSGWVDENAITGAERTFGGDVATVAVQYSDKPSWATFLFAEDDARRSANAVVRAVATRAAAEPTTPKVVVYGQSLGSIAGSDAYLAVRQNISSLCAAVWAGPPAGSVDTDGAAVLANSSDPVARWSLDLLWSPPNTTTFTIDAPRPPWLPVVGFLQTSVDLLAALDVAPGHGHRYGTDQGEAMARCR